MTKPVEKTILFKTDAHYNGTRYLKGEAYKLKDSPEGFINRWLKRGHEDVSSDKSVKGLPDPRLSGEKEDVPGKTVPSVLDKPESKPAEKPADEKPADEKPAEGKTQKPEAKEK